MVAKFVLGENVLELQVSGLMLCELEVFTSATSFAIVS